MIVETTIFVNEKLSSTTIKTWQFKEAMNRYFIAKERRIWLELNSKRNYSWKKL